ncbi:MAG: ABC transporter ATP-binding protein [Alphaproteobacteria bacterium]|nr:ABC transporter ATP-binding protein [Alphaproteobacteria bacterium]
MSSISSIPLQVEHIGKSYGAHRVLEDISFALQPGEIFGLVGLNGAGKTTLIKLLLDLARADSGSAHIFGKPSTTVEARAQLSYLPEKFSPSRYLKGFEHLALALSYYGKKLDREKARALARTLDLDPEVLDGKVGGYSKGMGQKLGLMGAFMVDQPFMILDEPMSGLDPRARICLKEAMLEAKREGKTLFFSSHILSDIDEICDRIGIIHARRLVYLGTAAAFKPTFGGESLERAFLKAIGAEAA